LPHLGGDKGTFIPAFHFDAPAAGSQSFSFVGVIYPDAIFNVTFLRMSDLLTNPVAVDEVILGTAVPLPENSSLLLLLGGMAGFSFTRQRRWSW
jgi:hypothetical protein